MRHILKAFLSYLPRRKSLSVILTLGVAFGVASAIGMEISSQQALNSMEQAVSFAGGRATHLLRGTAGSLNEIVLKELSADKSVERFAPVIDKMLHLPHIGPLRVLGVDPFLETAFRDGWYERRDDDYMSLLDGQPRLVIDKGLAERNGFQEGDKISTDRGEAIIAGLFEVPSGQPMAWMEISAAQKFFDVEGKIDRVDLILNDPDGFYERWGERFSIMTVRNNRVLLQGMLASFRLNLRAISMLGLFVGIFLVYNTATFAVASRKKDAGILLALGAYRKEIALAFMTELALLGLLGGVLGAFAGYALSHFLTGIVGTTVTNLYFFLTPEKPHWSWWFSLIGAGLGLTTCLIAGIRPIAQYSNIKPLEVLHGRVPEKSSYKRAIYYGLAGCLLATLSLYIYLLEFEGFYQGALVVTLLLVLASLFSPLITFLAMKTIRPFIKNYLGLRGTISVDNLRRRLGRSSVAVAALSVALAASIGMGLMIGSFRSTLVWWLDGQLTGDLYIATSPGLEIPEHFFQKIKTIENIDGVDPYTNVPIFINNNVANLSAVSPKVLKQFANFGWFEGSDASWDAVEDGQVIISESLHRRFGSQVGERIPIKTPEGVVSLEVAGIFYDYTSEHGVVMMSRERYISLFGDRRIDSLGIFFDPDNKMKNEAINEVRALAQEYKLPVLDRDGLHKDILKVFDSTFASTKSMQFLAIIVACLGMVGTMLTMLIEKKKDLGILRALGFGRADIVWMTAMEGFFIGSTSIFIALFVGVSVAVVLVNSINLQSFNWTIFFELQATPFVEAFAAGIIATLLALIYPTWMVLKTYPNLQLKNE